MGADSGDAQGSSGARRLLPERTMYYGTWAVSVTSSIRMGEPLLSISGVLLCPPHPYSSGTTSLPSEIIVCEVRWYLRYALSYRDIEERLLERGLHVDHTTVFRWVQRYAPEFDKRCRRHLTATTDANQPQSSR